MKSLAWRVLGTGSAVLAARLADRGVRAGWRAVTGTAPPVAPENPDTGWLEAASWAVLSGAAVGIARLAATRRAATYYRASTGQLPKALQRPADSVPTTRGTPGR